MERFNFTTKQWLAIGATTAVLVIVGGYLYIRYNKKNKTAKADLAEARKAAENAKAGIKTEPEVVTEAKAKVADAVEEVIEAQKEANDAGTKLRQEIADIINATAGKGEQAFKNAQAKVAVKMEELHTVEHLKKAA